MDLNTISEELHKTFISVNRFTFPLQKNALPINGIYILFERNEKYDSLDRIVRIGTHTGNGRFVNRLKDHFGKDNQRNSIFRKHIGRCLLNKVNDPYLTNWDLPFKKIEDKAKNKTKFDLNYEKEYELIITAYIQSNLSFAVIPNVNSEEDRLQLESALISTIANDAITFPSANWLGKFHPNSKISNGKLWNIQQFSTIKVLIGI